MRRLTKGAILKTSSETICLCALKCCTHIGIKSTLTSDMVVQYVQDGTGEEGVCGEAWRVACLTSGLRKLATTSYEVGGTRLPTLRSADYQAGGPWDRRGGCQSEGANPVIISLAAPPMLLARRRRARNQDPPKP